MNDIKKRATDAQGKLNALMEEFCIANDDRTMFQLEKFVVGQNDTPERKYVQVMCELRTCYFEIRKAMLDREEADIDAEDARQEDDPRRADVKRKKAMLAKERVEFYLDAKLKEFEKLMHLKESLPSFSRQEIEDAEEGYFDKRLNRQALEERVAATLGVSVGNLRSLMQIGYDVKMTPQIENGKSTTRIEMTKKGPQEKLA